MTKVSIVVLNWNGAKDTAECLRSVSELRIMNYELGVILVDNASIDGSINYLKSQIAKWPTKSDPRGCKIKTQTVKLIGNKENLGFAGGNNVGLKQALEDGADFVLVLNNDTVVDKNLIVEFLAAVKKYPDAGVFSPKIYFAKGYEFHKDIYKRNDLGKVIWSAGGDFDWDNVLGSNSGVDEVDKGQFDEVREVDFATGAAMFIKREILEKVGFFNEDYFMYLEDVEFCVRTKNAGFKILYVPGAKLWHKVAQSSKVGGGLNDYYTTRNRLLFGMRYAALRAKLALLRESARLFLSGRSWQKQGVRDFYLGRLGRGSYV